MKVILQNSNLVFAAQKPVEYLVNESVNISQSELYRPQVGGTNFVFDTSKQYKIRVVFNKQGTLTSVDNLSLVDAVEGVKFIFEPSKHNGVAINFIPTRNFTCVFQSASDALENYTVQIWEA